MRALCTELREMQLDVRAKCVSRECSKAVLARKRVGERPGRIALPDLNACGAPITNID